MDEPARPGMVMTLHCGDCREVMAAMEAASVDAVVTDPPYGLEFMGKEWDSFGRRANHPMDPSMQITRDGSVKPRARDNPWQKEASGYGAPKKNPRCRCCGRLRFNKPQWRCDCAEPDWGTRTREYAQDYQAWCETWAAECLRVLKPGGYLLAFGGTRTYHRLACAVEDAGFEIRDSLHWIYGSGFPKSRACLKPSHEPIVLARKPAGRMVPLNIDGCRVGTSKDVPASAPQAPNGIYGKRPRDPVGSGFDSAIGRWPPNVLLGPEAAAELDTQSGTAPSNRPSRNITPREDATGWGFAARAIQDYADDGGASRFFPVFKYQAKAPASERPRLPDGTTWPTVKPLGLMRWLVRLVTPPGGQVLDPFAGTGTTGEACALEGFDCVLIEQDPKAVELARIRLGKPVQPMMGV